MPSGQTHLRIEATLLFGWTALAGFLLSSRSIPVESVVAFVLAYAFSMLLLSPDLDLARSRASRRWGIGRWLWIPYAAVFRHRGLSHHPLLGPLTRVLYLATLGACAVFLLVAAIGRPAWLPSPSVGSTVGALLGLYVPNVTHITVDQVVSAWRGGRARRRL